MCQTPALESPPTTGGQGQITPTRGADSLIAKASRQEPQHQRGFVRITHKRCPDCEYEGNLSTDGRPLIVGGGQLRGASSYVGLTKASHGCETCEGTGYLTISPLDPESIDPYARKAK